MFRFYIGLNEPNIQTIWMKYLMFAVNYLYFIFHPAKLPQSDLHEWILFPYDFLTSLNYYNCGCMDPASFTKFCKRKIEEWNRDTTVTEEQRQKWIEFFTMRMFSNDLTFDVTLAPRLIFRRAENNKGSNKLDSTNPSSSSSSSSSSSIKEKTEKIHPNEQQYQQLLNDNEIDQLQGLGFLKLPWPNETEISGMIQIRRFIKKETKTNDQQQTAQVEECVQNIKLDEYLKIHKMEYLRTDRWYKLLTKNDHFLFEFNTTPL